jgi:hypothetical protein
MIVSRNEYQCFEFLLVPTSVCIAQEVLQIFLPCCKTYHLRWKTCHIQRFGSFFIKFFSSLPTFENPLKVFYDNKNSV